MGFWGDKGRQEAYESVTSYNGVQVLIFECDRSNRIFFSNLSCGLILFSVKHGLVLQFLLELI